MKDEQGREIVARLADMIPLTIAVEVLRGVSRSIEKAGYDAVILTDGPHAGWIAAVPRAKRKRKRAAGRAPAGTDQPQSGPPAAEGGAPTAPDI